MQVTFLGSRGPIITRKHRCTCVLIDEDTLIDVGIGSITNIVGLNVNIATLTRVLLTHYHADHVSDLVPLLWTVQISSPQQEQHVEIGGFGDVKRFVEVLLETMHLPHVGPLRLSYRSLSGNDSFADTQTLLTIHSPFNLAYKITRNGKSVCFSGDTAYFEPLADFARNCDFLVHEASFLKNQRELALKTNHSTAQDAGRIAEKAGVKKLVLSHISPLSGVGDAVFAREAIEEFSGEVIIAEDGLVLKA